MRFSDDAKAENRLARLVGDIHSQFSAGKKGVVQIPQDFAGGFGRLDPNRGHIRQIDPVTVESRALAVADAEKVSSHGLAFLSYCGRAFLERRIEICLVKIDHLESLRRLRDRSRRRTAVGAANSIAVISFFNFWDIARRKRVLTLQEHKRNITGSTTHKHGLSPCLISPCLNLAR